MVLLVLIIVIHVLLVLILLRVSRVSSGPPYLCDASGFAGARSAACYCIGC